MTTGFDPTKLAAAIVFAEAHESPWRRDLRAQLEAGNFEPPPDNEIIGPVAPRGPPNGLLMRHGEVVARWGNTRQVDMTFSVAKSYLSMLAGIAVSDGLIADLDEPIGRTVQGRRLRQPAERGHHLAPDAAIDLRMGGQPVRQIRADRP